MIGITSPPFVESVHVDRKDRWNKDGYWAKATGNDPNRPGKALIGESYGTSEGQIPLVRKR